MKIYGPYTRKDKRQHIIIIDDQGNKQTQSYPRYLMEVHLGRKLSSDETIDHIDEDVTNNSVENLRILSLSENVKEYHLKRPRKMFTFTCECCGVEASKWLNTVKGNKKKGKSGPFCSRSCAGKATYKNPWNKT